MANDGHRRIGWDDYFLQVADAVALRADCTRRKVGAVLVGQDRKVISTGYNGSPPGEPGCLSDGACPRGRHYRTEIREGEYQYFKGYKCACGLDWPCAMSVAPSSSYDTGPGACIALHAESNAVIWAGQSARGATMYITDEPCLGCKKLMAGAGVKRATWYGGSVILVLSERKRHGVPVRKLVQRLRRY